MSFNYLQLTDIETLGNLLLRSQESKAREALCIRIGIKSYRLSFFRDSSDEDFVLQLIEYLDRTDNKEALCKLCCEELFPIFRKSEIYAPILIQIAVKLNCNQKLSQNSTNSQQPTVLSSSPAPSLSVNPFIQLAKNKLVIGSAIFLIALAGFSLYNQNSKPSNNPHLTEQPISQTPNLSPRANSNKSMEQQIIDIYQEKLGRKPTEHEMNSFVNLLESGGKSSSILDSIIKTSLLLQEGNIISLECLGNLHTDFKFLDSRLKNNNVSLDSNINAYTKWKVHVINDGVVALENLGKINGLKWLDGLTANNSVNLAPNTEGGYIGTKWTINILGDGVVALDNQGESKWLNGVTADGSVNLAPNIGEDYTGTR